MLEECPESSEDVENLAVGSLKEAYEKFVLMSDIEKRIQNGNGGIPIDSDEHGKFLVLYRAHKLSLGDVTKMFQDEKGIASIKSEIERFNSIL